MKEKSKTQTVPVVKKKNFNFEYKYTEAELKEKAKLLSEACAERNSIEDAKKSAASTFKSQIDGKNAEINILAENIRTGRQYLTKTCDCHYDFDKGVKTYAYEGDVVGEEKLSEQDYQLTILEGEVK